MNIRLLSSGTALFVTMMFVGCGGGGGGLPEGETGTVSGSVTHAGSPVAEGSTVTFIQVGGTGIVGTATSDAAGKYTLSMRNGPDILVGKYMVGVSPPNPAANMTPEEIMELPEPPETPKAPYDEKYLSPESSGIVVEVKAGENALDITLE